MSSNGLSNASENASSGTSSNISQMTDCLQELRVVDLTRNLPGPFATRLLADLGAEIIKIEPKNGDPARALGGAFRSLESRQDD